MEGRRWDITSREGGLLLFASRCAPDHHVLASSLRHIASRNASGTTTQSVHTPASPTATWNTPPGSTASTCTRPARSTRARKRPDRSSLHFRLTYFRPCYRCCENFWLVEQLLSRVFLPLPVRVDPPPVTYTVFLDSASYIP